MTVPAVPKMPWFMKSQLRYWVVNKDASWRVIDEKLFGYFSIPIRREVLNYARNSPGSDWIRSRFVMDWIFFYYHVFTDRGTDEISVIGDIFWAQLARGNGIRISGSFRVFYVRFIGYFRMRIFQEFMGLELKYS